MLLIRPVCHHIFLIKRSLALAAPLINKSYKFVIKLYGITKDIAQFRIVLALLEQQATFLFGIGQVDTCFIQT